jgi:hypothetical protein
MKQYTELLTAIAAHLGAPWKFNKLKQGSSWQRELIDGQGRTLLFISDPRFPNKFEIAGIMDSGFAFKSNGSRLSIKVSVRRTAKALANDIKRRLLPEYFEIFSGAREYALVRKKEIERFDDFTHAFMTATGGKKDDNRWNDACRIVRLEYPNNPDKFHTIAQLHRYDDKIAMRLSKLTFEQAVKIANILRDTA